MLPKRVMSWKEAWEDLFRAERRRAVQDLARYGITMPIAPVRPDRHRRKDHLSHQAWSTFYNYGAATNFHTWMPDEDEMAWLSAKYPNSFDKHYRPRYGSGASRPPRATASTTRRCRCCARPARSRWCSPSRATRPRSATGSRYKATKYHFCSTTAEDLRDEPEKYVQAWLPVHQIYQGSCFPEGTDPTVEASTRWPRAEVLQPRARSRQPRFRRLGRPEELRSLARSGHQNMMRSAPRASPARGVCNTNSRHGCSCRQGIPLPPPIPWTSSTAPNCCTSAGRPPAVLRALCLPVPADMRFGDIIAGVLPGVLRLSPRPPRSTGRRPSGSSRAKPGSRTSTSPWPKRPQAQGRDPLPHAWPDRHQRVPAGPPSGAARRRRRHHSSPDRERITKHDYELTIEPIGQTIEVEDDQTILDAALRAGIWLPHACCHGLCATCKVRS